MVAKVFDPAAPAAKGYETPTFDKLAHRQKIFVLAYAKCHDEHQAALEAGYAARGAAIWGFELGRDPNIVKALEEVTARNMNSAEFSRAAVVQRLKIESSVTMEDLAEEKEVSYEGKTYLKWKPKKLEDIPMHYRGCTGFVTVSREGNAQFNNSAQQKARELLAKYMNWDKQGAETNPPVMFNFGGLKPGL